MKVKNPQQSGHKTRPPVLAERPAGLILLGLRLPIWLYRFHLGWVLGYRFLLLVHKGRKSGRTRMTVLEVVKHDRNSSTFFVVSGWGADSDWYLNVQKHPNVVIRSGGLRMPACAEAVCLEESVKILEEYSYRHPIALKELTALLLGERLEPGPDAARRLAERMPMIGFHPRAEELPR
jgi:deazaflavin-dependent oxidoreductase (nitroreductase family)